MPECTLVAQVQSSKQAELSCGRGMVGRGEARRDFWDPRTVHTRSECRGFTFV